MIKRTYFVSAVKHHDDNNGSFSFKDLTLSYTSFFPNPDYIFKSVSDRLVKEMEDLPGKVIQIIAFNRI